MEWKTTATGIQGFIEFKDQTELAEFVLKLAQLSDKMNHHADMEISYNRLSLNIFTHDKAAVTSKDENLCQEIEKLIG
jgi:4a-hydroxytetrahydrobiopterin dehydratase